MKNEVPVVRINTRIFIFIILCSCIFSCKQKQTLATIKLDGIEISDGNYSGKNIAKHKATVFTFLSPECPVSEAYTKTLNQLISVYADSSVQFINVFPGNFYTQEKINAFKNNYTLAGINTKDENKILVHLLSATITPECFLINSNGEVLYSGAIDNWAVDLGTNRQIITAHYLEDAIHAVLNGEMIKVKKTEAVGCFIE